MHPITFIDTEIEPNSQRVQDIGALREGGGDFRGASIAEFAGFLTGAEFVCGHNILRHDVKYIGHALEEAGLDTGHIVDTLFLSPLLFPARPYHKLVKDDKLQSEDLNNPLNDSRKGRDLFWDEVNAFRQLDIGIQRLFFLLLGDQPEFAAFFHFLDYDCENTDLVSLIRELFQSAICAHADLQGLVVTRPIELAYCLALIRISDSSSITPPWVLKNYPEVEQVMFLLRSKPCLTGCAYCNDALDIHKGLMRLFGYSAFRTFGNRALQEEAVQAAVGYKSILVVFPTGGGKSITFQLPALMAGDAVRGLTVVIAPLQSLMKDQVDNLEDKGITSAVTLNGLLDPIERSKAYQRVESGAASILYISPESLRSRSIERLLLGRNIVRFVIDEAHCFSVWGQDFRVDYLYIGDFIQALQQKKGLNTPIPVSCFTATARQKVIEDIQRYFLEKLGLDMALFTANAARENLHYKVLLKEDDEQKYLTVRDWIEEKNCPTIIYVSRTRKAYALAERLVSDGFNAKPYHGKMEVNEKTANQNAFLSGQVQIMVATSAFGMGVDKKDVGLVIHFEISDSLENYVQEAGRAGRDEAIQADCYVLYNEDDLSKHFALLQQTKLSIKEIQQIWIAIKEMTRFRSTVSNSALEIARLAGWDDSMKEIETRVTTAIAALENVGYLKRRQNMPRIFATSILARNAQEAINKIDASSKFDEAGRDQAIRIIKKLISSRSRKPSDDEVPEARIDYIGDQLGIKKEEVIRTIQLLREEKILADTKDLTAFIKRRDNKNRSLTMVESYGKIEQYLLTQLNQQETSFHLKQLNENAEGGGCPDVTPYKIKTVINFWAIKKWIKRKPAAYNPNLIVAAANYSREQLTGKLLKRLELAKFIVGFLFDRSQSGQTIRQEQPEEVLVEFSVHELKYYYDKTNKLFMQEASIEDVEDSLFYLSRIGAIKIEGGFMVLYNRLTIERTQLDNKKRYTQLDYQSLNQFYENKTQQIHIVGTYAEKMIEDYKAALQFTDDYFQLNYGSFLRKYFPGSRLDDLRLKMTPTRFKQLFGDLSAKQLAIVNDKSKYIVVAAGPGSGKTRILVHKLAALLLMEDVRSEQLLMLTFSRAAATELKKRLLNLIGPAANYVDIKTFHSYAFDLLGRVGSLEKAQTIIQAATGQVKRAEVEPSRVTKTVLVIDEAQDMDLYEFELVEALMGVNEDIRVIAVGDDDQNIYAFRGSSPVFLGKLAELDGAVQYDLIENYRSRPNLVDFTNQFVGGIQHRLKQTAVIATHAENGLIKVVHYSSIDFITPFVQDILRTDLKGTTCVLTTTNREAVQVTSLLLRAGLPAKLIQTNDGFDLSCMVEFRFFIQQVEAATDGAVIDETLWMEAIRVLKEAYRDSIKLEICLNLIRDFETIHPRNKYKSDFLVFVKESKLEDFYTSGVETVFVSTIHKAKGREFDQVFLLLQNLSLNSEDKMRQLYVAMTRAKNNLHIHLNGGYLDDIRTVQLERVEDKRAYPAPIENIIPLTHSDVQLGYGRYVGHLAAQLRCGMELQVTEEGCLNKQGKMVAKFSKKFKQEVMAEQARLQYLPVRAVVNFIVHWMDKDNNTESLIVLPTLYLKRLPDGNASM